MKRVVFVDDSKTVILTAELALKDLIDKGVIEFKSFDNPLDLLEAVENGFTYDLLITDINMPQMSGLEMAKKLKANPNVAKKPIVALTTENSIERKKEGKAIGLTGWITKPFTPEKLLMGIKRVLRI